MKIIIKFQLEPHHDHWITSKHILRYFRGTIRHYLKYDCKEIKLIGFTYFDWGGSESDGRNITGGFFSLGPAMISWMSRKKVTIALSSIEA